MKKLFCLSVALLLARLASAQTYVTVPLTNFITITTNYNNGYPAGYTFSATNSLIVPNNTVAWYITTYGGPESPGQPPIASITTPYFTNYNLHSINGPSAPIVGPATVDLMSSAGDLHYNIPTNAGSFAVFRLDRVIVKHQH